MAKSAFIGFKIEGVSHLTNKLRSIKESLRNRYMRKAVEKASRIVRKAARAKIKTGRPGWVPTGLLKRSIEIKVRSYDSGVILGVVGPSNDAVQVIRTRKKPKAIVSRTGKRLVLEAGTDVLHRPSKIAHLVEYGHGGPYPAPAYPFMRPAWDESKEACMAAIKDTLEAALVKEQGK